MDQQLLNELKQTLLQKEQVFVDRVNSLRKEQRRGEGPIDPDFEEQAHDVENDEVIDRLEEIDSLELQEIRAALKRIDQGQYGKCTMCGADIKENRLKAVPYTSLCFNCSNS